MNTISATLAMTWKEIQLLLRDRGSLAVLFLMPLLIGSFYGFMNLQAAEEEGDEAMILLHVLLVNNDEGAFGSQVEDALAEVDELRVVKMASLEQAEEITALGEAAAAVVIPSDFSHNVDSHMPSTVEIIVDPAQQEGASIVAGIMNQVLTEVTIWGEIQFGIRTLLDESGLLADADEEVQRAVEAQNLGVIMTSLNELRRNPAIVIASEDLEGEATEGGITTYFAYLFPGLTVMFAFFGVSLSGASLMAERDSGTLTRLLASPMSRGSVMAGKILAVMLLVAMQVLVLFGVASLFFGMPLGQSPIALVSLTLVLGLAVAALGLFIAALAKTYRQADNAGTILGFVLAGIGGAIAVSATPLFRSGGFIGVLSKFTPHAHAVEGFYKVMAEDAGLIEITPQLGALLGMSIIFVLVARWRFRFT